MASLNTLEASNVILPKDLVITAQPNIDSNYFTVTAKGLELDSLYNFQFQWVYADGTVGPWSPSVILFTPTEGVPDAPSVAVPSTSTGYIPVTLTTFPLNALRVDVKITGGDFGDGTKTAYSFFSAGTTTIPASAGVYYVELYTVTPTGIDGTPTSAFTITVSDNTIPVLSPETPDAPTAKAGLASVIVEWNGKKTGGVDFTTGSFAGAKVFIGTTAGFTPSADNWVHTLNFANGSNKVSIGVGSVINKTAGTLLAYGTPYYVKIDTINANGVANNNPIAASGVPVTVSKLPASEISTGTITADNSITAGVSGGQRVVISGSAAPFIIYGTDGTTKLLEYVTSGTTGSLAIKGSGTFTGSLEIGSGNNIFKADPSVGIWLGNAAFASADFSVSTTGILKANAGKIGDWTITSNQITSGGTDYISLIPGTPRISIVKTSSTPGTITIDPIDGIKGTNFQVTPAGNLTATNAEFTGGKITVNAGVDNIIVIGKGVEGSNNGIYINPNNYWYGTGLFSVGNATNKMVWNNTKLSITGEVNATSGYIGSSTLGWEIGEIGVGSGLYGISAKDGTMSMVTGTGLGILNVGNYSISATGGYFNISESVSGSFRDILTTSGVDSGDGGKIYLGDYIAGVGGRSVYVAKSAQIAGGTENAASGGLRNMFTSTVTLFNTVGAANIYAGSLNGDVLLVYTP